MTDEQNTSRAERLDNLLRKVAPKAMALRDEHGKWPLLERHEPSAERRYAPPQEHVASRAKAMRDAGKQDDEAFSVEDRAAQSDNAQRGAPYEIKTVENGFRVVLTGDDGDIYTGNGPTVEDALQALEAKVS